MNATTDISDLPERRYRGDYMPIKRLGKRDYTNILTRLRWCLFALSAMLLGYVSVESNLDLGSAQVILEESATAEDLNISVRNARYAGLDAGELPFIITAGGIIQDKTTPDEIKMETPKADITLKNGEWIYMSADQAVIETNGSRMLIEDNVEIDFSIGYELKTDHARMNMKLGIILGDTPVTMKGINSNFTSAGFRIHNSGQSVALLGPANVNIRNDEAMNISAKDVLEWHRDKHSYSAEGSVQVKNAGMILKADKLEVFYQKILVEQTERQMPNLIKVQDNVRLETSGGIIYADSAVYDIRRGFVSFFGDDIRMDSQEVKLNADKSLEYWTEGEIAIARGNAEVLAQGGKSLKAETIRAKISLLNGKKQISYATAEKNVAVNTGTSLITGNDGRYDFTTQQGKICGALKIIEQDTTLGGECATINMQTGVSQIQSSESNGRVRGTFGTQE